MIHAVDGTVKVIYETMRLRSTKAHTQVWDMRADETYPANFKVRCETHDREIPHDVRLKAEEISHRSHMWCDICTIPEAGVEKRTATWVSREHGTEIAVSALPDSTSRNERVYAGWFGSAATAPWKDPRKVTISYPRKRG